MTPGPPEHSQVGPSNRYFGLHGWSGDRSSFDPLRPHIPPKAQWVAPDQPGFGACAAPARWDFEHCTAPLLSRLDELGWDQCTLVGNCAGAVIALEMAIRQPERFERLVLIDPFAYVPWYFRWLTHRHLGRLFYFSTFANPVGRWITNNVLRAKRTTDTSLVDGLEAVRHEAAFSYLSMLCQGTDAGRYGGLKLPITLVFGANTFTAVKRSVAIYQRLWPQAEAFELQGAGHLPIQEATAQLAMHALGGQDYAHSEPCDLPDGGGEPTHRSAVRHHSSLGTPV